MCGAQRREIQVNSRLNEIKRTRELSIGQPYNLVKRILRRYRQLSRTYPQYRVLAYLLQRVVKRVSASIALITRRSILPHPSRTLRAEKGEYILYAVRITGGIGDAIISARLIRDLQARLGVDFHFDVYYQTPALITPFFSQIAGFRQSNSIAGFDLLSQLYSVTLTLNQFAILHLNKTHGSQLAQQAPQLLHIISKAEQSRKPIEQYIASHPFFDGAFADQVAPQGYKRHRYLHAMLGLEYGGNALTLPLDPAVVKRIGLSTTPYLTVHDGWDTKFNLVASRPTKVLPPESWAEIVREIKTKRPDLRIVQIGGNTGSTIHGVDLDLKGQLSFLESLAILASSQLHIDTESGLVHAATSLGVHCIVMFGPTNLNWFSYSENTNIAPKACGNCWWATDSWMDVCAIGENPPICTRRDSIIPLEVAGEALSALTSHINRRINRHPEIK